MKQKILMVLVDGFEELEAIAVADILRRLDFRVTLAGLKRMENIGAHQIKVTADCLLDECLPADFDAVVLPGGMPGALNLRACVRLEAFLKEMHRSGKITAAICAAPIVLSQAGLLKNCKFTMYPGFDDYLDGEISTGNLAEADGTVITGKGPGAVFAFAAKIAEALGKGAAVVPLYKGMFVGE